MFAWFLTSLSFYPFLSAMVSWCIWIVVWFCSLIVFGALICRCIKKRPVPKDNNKTPIDVAFFHPFCNSGGGGERVLWHAVQQMLLCDYNINIKIYTGDVDASPESIIKKAKNRFGLKQLPEEQIEFIYLKKRKWVQASMYPRFTLIGQSLGSIVLAVEALWAFTPHIFIDTTGYSFTYPVARFLFGSRVVAYVHYPTISTDMLQKVRARRPDYNNDHSVSQSVTASTAKLIYYYLFAFLYFLVGQACEVVMVNSSWTAAHIASLWRSSAIVTVYPPCDAQELQSFPLGTISATNQDENKTYNRDNDNNDNKNDSNDNNNNNNNNNSIVREELILSIGQFRPEKDHLKQIEAFDLFCQQCPIESKQVRLVMIGGVRDQGDQTRLDNLIEEASKRGLSDRVSFLANAPWPKLKQMLSKATAGLHTMWNEHFGIGVVEFMAAGVITIAHNSGGPKEDIVIEHEGVKTGFLADSAQEYADCLKLIFSAPFKGSHKMQMMRQHARLHCVRFSDQVFAKSYGNALAPLIQDFLP